MKFFIGIVSIAIVFLMSGLAYSADGHIAENWEKEAAWRASVSVDTSSQRELFQQLLKAGDSEGTLDLIRTIETQPGWPAPARERVLFEYVSTLRQEPRDALGPSVIEYLGKMQPITLIPHEDHPRSSVPMFNIRATVAGVENGWSRREAAFEGAVHLAAGAEALLVAYLDESSTPRRSGLLDSLAGATPSQLKAVSQLALAAMDQHPELIALASKAAQIGRDIDTIESLLSRAQGTEISRLLIQSSRKLDLDQKSRLLQAALRNASAETAALTIAQLAPALVGHAPTEALLLTKLADPALGSAAALALSRNPSPDTLRQLETLAASGNQSLEATRARLALKMRASRYDMGVLP